MPDAPLSTAVLAAMLDASAQALAEEAIAQGALARVRPGPDDWCANEILGHLIEAERRAFNGRIRGILAGPGASVATWDPSAVAAARNDRGAPTDSLLAELAEVRSDSLALLRGLADAQLPLVGVHPRVGPLSVGEIAHEWIHHDREHLIQLLEVTRTFAWRGMGTARRFSDPDA